MNLTTVDGKIIDVTEWLDRMRENHRLKRNIFEQTPIGTKADKSHFWWDEEENPDLTKESVKKLVRSIKRNA